MGVAGYQSEACLWVWEVLDGRLACRYRNLRLVGILGVKTTNRVFCHVFGLCDYL